MRGGGIAFVYTIDSPCHFQNLNKYKKKFHLISFIKRKFFKYKRKHDFLKTIKEKLKHYDYDLLIDFSGCLDEVLRRNDISPSLPILRWVHGQILSNRARKNKRFRCAFLKYKKVIVLNEDMRDIFKQKLNLKEEHFFVLPNPINGENIKRLAQEQVDLTKYKPYLLQVSRFDDGKGHEELIDIYHHLVHHHGLSHHLVFVGDGKNMQLLQDKVKHLNLTDKVHFLGELKNPYPYFQGADLFVHTSESEGLPTVLIESLACGTPVVAMDCPTGPAYILGNEGHYGRLIKLYDKENFAQAILELTKDNAFLSLKENAEKRAQDFSHAEIKKRFLMLVNEIKCG